MHRLKPLAGDLYVPFWLVRPGGVEALSRIPRGLRLWMVIRSSNGGRLRPCTMSRGSLGATLDVSVPTVTRALQELRMIGLLLELPFPVDRHSGKHVPPARFAVDPMRWWGARERDQIDVRVPELAEERGLDSRWVRRAFRRINSHGLMVASIARSISRDVEIVSPRIISDPLWMGDGKGGGQQARRACGETRENEQTRVRT